MKGKLFPTLFNNKKSSLTVIKFIGKNNQQYFNNLKVNSIGCCSKLLNNNWVSLIQYLMKRDLQHLIDFLCYAQTH